LTDVLAHVDVDSRMNDGCTETPPYIGKRADQNAGDELQKIESAN